MLSSVDDEKEKEIAIPNNSATLRANLSGTTPASTGAVTTTEHSHFKVYNPPRSSPNSPPTLPDSYFTPTAGDLRAAQAALSARTQSIMNAPLQSKSAREAAELKSKLERWPTTKIRMKFSDRTQLEKVFQSTEKIRSVYAFVRSSLREDVKPIKFVLYQTPPLREMKVSDPKVRDLSLAELQLSPSSVLLLKFEDDSLNATDVPAPLAADILAQAVDLPLPPVFDNDKHTAVPSSSVSSTTSSGDKKVPKWFKMGQKK